MSPDKGTTGLKLHRVGNIYRVAKQIEPVGKDIGVRSAAAEERIVDNIVNSPNSPEKAEAIYQSSKNVRKLETHNKDKMIHGMIKSLDSIYADSRISDFQITRVAKATNRSESYRTEAHHVAVAKLVAENPQAGRLLVENSPNREEAGNRSGSTPPIQDGAKIPKTKPVDVRHLGAAQEERLAASIARNPDARVMAEQMALYRNKLKDFEPKNKEAIVNGVIQTLKNEHAPFEAKSAISNMLMQSQEHISTRQNTEISKIVLGKARGGPSVADGDERAASRPNLPNRHDLSNARDDLLHNRPARTRSAGR